MFKVFVLLLSFLFISGFESFAQSSTDNQDVFYREPTYGPLECFHFKNGGVRLKQEYTSSANYGITQVSDVYLDLKQKNNLINILIKAKKWMKINETEQLEFEKTLGCFYFSTWYEKKSGSFITQEEVCVKFFGMESGESKIAIWDAVLSTNSIHLPGDYINFKDEFSSPKELDSYINVLQGKKSAIDKKFK